MKSEDSKAKVNVRTIQPIAKANIEMSPASKQIYNDDFEGEYGAEIIEPPYYFSELKIIGEYSTILQQCYEAYKTNVIGFGFSPEYSFDFNSPDVKKEQQEEAKKEWVQMQEFIKFVNFEEAAETIVGYAIEDLEKTGNGFLEVTRNGEGKPSGIEYMDVVKMRVCRHTVPDEVTYQITENGKPIEVKQWKRFRRYVQMADGGKKVFFKEFGDKRIMNMTNGRFDDNTPENLRATEVIHLKVGSGTYGKPRWIGHLINVYGARKAEELNFAYFKNGRHVPAAILVKNGELTEESFDEMQKYVEQVQGVENAYKFLFLEVTGNKGKNNYGEETYADADIQIKSLAEMVQKDALFLEYDEKHRQKIRSAFRLHPIYTGESQDYNKATAETARKITEEQVFQPYRKSIAGKLNTLFSSEFQWKYVRLTLKGPNFRDPADIAKAITPLIGGYGVAPNNLRNLVAEILGVDELEEWPEEIYNRPIIPANKNSITLPELTEVIKSDRDYLGQQSKELQLLKEIRDRLLKGGNNAIS